MGRYIEAVCKICRRCRMKLFLKGQRCYTAKCPMEKGAHAPGQLGMKRRRLTDYGIHLRELQRARRHYGTSNTQLKRLFHLALKQGGDPTENIIKLLERRLDNAIYRAGLALSRAQARQMIVHRHVRVNGRRVMSPSYLVRPGDIVTPDNSQKSIQLFKESYQVRKELDEIPSWIKLVKENPPQIQVSQQPDPNETQVPFEPRLIIEFLSK